MAFCNSCGAALTPGTRFCSKCGVAVLASSPAPAAGSAAPVTTPAPAATIQTTTTQGGGAVKIILIVVGVIVLLGVLGVTSVVFAWRMAHHTHVRQEGDNVKVETPFGTVESTKDPQEAARNLGVDIYPGAKILQDGAASASFGGVHTVSVSFESDDSVDKVSSFYKSKFPNAIVTSSDSNQSTIVSNDHNNLITINIRAEGGRTKIQIANVTGKLGSSRPAN